MAWGSMVETVSILPGVLRRRWNLALTHLRAVERADATPTEERHTPLRTQVLGQFTRRARGLAR